MSIIQLVDYIDIDLLASISETGSLLASTSESGPIGRISTSKLRTRLNTGDQIFDAGVRMSAFGAGLVRTSSTGVISVSDQIVIDLSAPAGSLAINSAGKISIKDSIALLDDKLSIYGLDSDFSIGYSDTNKTLQFLAGNVIDTNVALEIDSALKTTLVNLHVVDGGNTIQIEPTWSGVGRIVVPTGGFIDAINGKIRVGTNSHLSGQDSMSVTGGINLHLLPLTGSLGIGTTSQFGSGVKVIGIANATTPPSTNPTGGGVLYCEGGAFKYRGSSGTITTIAPA